MNDVTQARTLWAIKLAHTLIWCFFAGCIIAIPVLAWLNHIQAAGWLIAIVFVEVLVVFFNRWSCPLTPVAARYTDDRRANFDIYLPEWLARYNKLIFGSLYFAGIVFTVIRSVWLN